jgi:APA family basic amino acid/polyamine antiporter
VPAVSRRLGLAASILVFLGYIVGASIFILPGTLGGTTGPGLVVSYILAAIPAAFSAAVLAYVGSAYPVSGSIFVVIKQTLPPYFSALMVMAYLMLVLTSLPLVAYGFADYIIYFWSDGSRQTLATGIVLFFVLVNSRGIDITASVQEFLVVVFCLVLLIFCVGGIWNGDADNLTPVFPRGFSPVVAAAMTLYFSFSGSNVVAEIAGEIKDPGRNIPLTLLIGTLLILGLYLAIPIALMMNQPWDKLGGSAAIATVAAKFLPPWLVTCIAVGALTAAATSINGPILGASRNVLAFSREGFLPRYFSNVNAKTRVPARGVFFVGVLIMLGVTVGKKIEDYADMAVISFMVIGVMQGYAAYRLPRIHPDVHQASEFKYSPLLHDLLTLGSIVIAVGILVLYIWKGWEMLAIFLAWVAAGSIFYVVRRRQAELNLSSEG